MDDVKPFGSYVKQRRLALSLTQQEVADAVGLTQGWVAKLERNEITSPRLSTLKRLAVALQMNENDLVVLAQYAKTALEAKRLIDSLASLTFDDPRELLAERIRRIELRDDDLFIMNSNLDAWERRNKREREGKA